MALASHAPDYLLTHLLRDVSRSFYLTLRMLPGHIRPQIGLAYLLARSTDTIADTEIIPIKQRLQALCCLRERILGVNQAPLNFGELLGPGALCEGQVSSAERTLLEGVEDILAMLSSLSALDRDLIRNVLSTITSGQELDLIRFAEAGPDRIVALVTEAELDDYTWRVAGCVGEFWTRICRTHLFPNASLDEARLLSNGIRFGKGLQLVNVLRDLPQDLRRGRCYVPKDPLTAHGLAPEDLVEPSNEPRFRPLYHILLDQSLSHLTAGWEYTNSLPGRCVRLRLACAWPILIGVKTLGRLRNQNVLDPNRRIKISRSEVRGLIARSVVSYPWPRAWRRLFARMAGG